MPYVFLVIVSLGFGALLHVMAKRRGRNPILWGSLGVCFWFLPLPFLLFGRNRQPDG